MADKQRDPVCNMEIEPGKAAGTSQHQGQTYYFCSTNCKQKFDTNPQQFAKGQGQSAGSTS